MNKNKEAFVLGFALFSMFFGAGNLILPPFLGFQSGNHWAYVALGFIITAVIIPILGVLAYSKLQGTMFDFAKKVSPLFSLIYCFLVYLISILLPAPRTASVTHEIAIAPFFNISPLITSSIYFIMVFIFVINRTKMIGLIGRFFTPLMVIILLSMIIVGLFSSPSTMAPCLLKFPLIDGFLEGYQTFDAIGAIVVGGVIIVSLKQRGIRSYKEKRILIKKAGITAGTCLLIIYAGLIHTSALYNSTFEINATRIEILTSLSTQTLGAIGTTFLSVLVGLACFTTAVGIITGTADYFKDFFKESSLAYTIIAMISCLIGVIVGQFDVHYIINIALPVLMFIYPITIVLIILHLLPNKFTKHLVFKGVVISTFLFSIPDFLKFIIPLENSITWLNIIPFAKQSLGWVIPSILVFLVLNYKAFSSKYK